MISAGLISRSAPVDPLKQAMDGLSAVLRRAIPHGAPAAESLRSIVDHPELGQSWALTLNNDQGAAAALTNYVYEAHKLFPYPVLSTRVPAAVALAYVETVSSRHGDEFLTAFLNGCPAVPLLQIGPVFLVGHFNPEYPFHDVLPGELCIPVWLSIADYAGLRADLIAQVQIGSSGGIRSRPISAAGPSSFAAHLDAAGHSLNPDDPEASLADFLDWILTFPTITVADEQAIAVIKGRDEAPTLDALPPDLRLLAQRFLFGARVLRTDSLLIGPAVAKELDPSLVADHQLCPVVITDRYCFLVCDRRIKVQIEDDFHNRAGRVPVFAIIPQQQFQQACSSQTVIEAIADSDTTQVASDEPVAMALSPTQFAAGARRPAAWNPDAEALLSYLLWAAGVHRASDIHLEFFDGLYHVRFTIDGVPKEVLKLPGHIHDALAARLKTISRIALEEVAPADGRFVYSIGTRRIQVRVKLLFDRYRKCRFVIRLLDHTQSVHGISGLGLMLEEMTTLSDAYQAPDGLLFLCGATGEGKSTTAYAILSELNKRNRVLYSLEDPPEFSIPGVTQIACTAETHKQWRELPSFATATLDLLRAAPDVISVGELRNAEAGQAFLEIGLSGHTGITTFHAKDVFSAVQRLLSWKLNPVDLSTTTRLFTCQRLVRRACRCHKLVPITAEQRRFFEEQGVSIPEDTERIPAAVGCNLCGGTGYYGRLAVMEMLRVTERIAGLIRQIAGDDDVTHLLELRRVAAEEGYRSMLQNALSKVLLAQTTLSEVDRVVSRVQRLNRVHFNGDSFGASVTRFPRAAHAVGLGT
jgi:general secretion pathway protein E